MASYLINSSYSAWHKSPVSTTITTHALSDLPFPTVTVCPPKGSNTALNYDLMKANNDSLTDEDRENLKMTISMLEQEHLPGPGVIILLGDKLLLHGLAVAALLRWHFPAGPGVRALLTDVLLLHAALTKAFQFPHGSVKWPPGKS